MPTAKSIKRYGEIDLITLVGNISKYESFDFDEELHAIRESTYDDYLKKISHDYYKFSRASDFRALIIHEQTHYLDLTASLWGVEYNLRKIRAIEKTTIERVAVFKLNYSELQCIHNNYTVQFEKYNYKDVQTFKHEYEYSEKFGVLLFIVLIEKNGRKTKIPLTMLSLFEGHAYSNEELIKIKDIQLINCKDVKEKYIKYITSAYDEYLNDPNNHEYNILIVLATIHMEKFGLNRKQILSFISAISGFSLNISSMHLSILANRIFEYINSELKYCIKADLCRNQLKHFLAFYTILRSFEYINHPGNESIKKELISLLKYHPLTFVNVVWNGITRGKLCEYKSFENSDIKVHLNRFQNDSYVVTREIFNHSMENYCKFKEDGYVVNDLNFYHLIDMFRDYNDFDIKPENSIIYFNKRVDIDVVHYFNEGDEYIKLSNLVESEVFKSTQKFHLDLKSAIAMHMNTLFQVASNPDIRAILHI